MKKDTNRICNVFKASFALSWVLLSISCVSEAYQSSHNIIQLTSSIQGSTTRGDTDIQSTTFESGQKIDVYITHTSDDATAVGTTPNIYTADGNGNMNINSSVYWPVSNINIRGYYPTGKVGINSTSFNVESSQIGDEDYQKSDLMYAQQLNQSQTSTPINLAFNHKLSKVIIQAKGEGVKITGISFQNVYRSIGFTAKGGTLGEPSTLGAQGNIEVATSESGESILAGAAIMPPQDLIGDFLVVSTDQGGAVFNLATSKTIIAGSQYTLQVTVGLQNINHTTTIIGWNDMGTDIINAADDTIFGFTDDIADMTYTGADITPSPDVYYGERKLVENADYTLFYDNNRNVGTATIYAVGKPGTAYGDLFSIKTFNIIKATPVITIEATTNSNILTGLSRRMIVSSSIGTLTYSSSTANINVSAADDGVNFTGVSEGSAVITASVAESENWNAASKTVLTVNVYPTINNFDYSGKTVAWVCRYSGKYKLEVWGAKGGGGKNCSYDYNSSNGLGGLGGYSYGTMTMIAGTTYYVTVGGEGETPVNANSSIVGAGGAGGFNGGGAGAAAAKVGTSGLSRSGGGGGASDISLSGTDGSDDWNTTAHLYSRIIVAGGGGSATWSNAPYTHGGYGGGENGGDGVTFGSSTAAGKGGTPTAGGAGGDNAGSFGKGGDAVQPTSYNAAGAGGGGWYGGGSGTKDSAGGTHCTGGGGSGYVYTSSTAANYPSGCLLDNSHYLEDAATIAGNTTFKSPSGTDETGHSGNGYARISWVSE